MRRIVERALALEPFDRYSTAQEVADELDAYLVMRPTATDRSAATRIWLWTRRNPQLSITLAMVVALGSLLTVSYAAVSRLRSDRADLAEDIERARAEKARVADELGETEAELTARASALKGLQRTFSEAQEDYQTILAARDAALQNADTATKKLAADLDTARQDRAHAEAARDLYEGFWNRARKEADEVARERDTFKKERERLREERDKAVKEREAARTGRAQAERQRDIAEAERQRAATARRKLEAELLRLASELTSIQAGRSTASDSGSGSTDHGDTERERESTKRVNAGP